MIYDSESNSYEDSLSHAAEMPHQAPTEPTGALKSGEGTKPTPQKQTSVQPSNEAALASSMTHNQPVTGREMPPILPAMAAKLKETNDTIGKLMTGEIDPASEEGVKHVTNLTAMSMGMGMFGAEGGAAGIFGGRLNQTSKRIAESFEKLGVDEKTIKGYTGLERGAEGIWRKELSDAESHMSIPEEKIDLRTPKQIRDEGWTTAGGGNDIPMLMKGDYKLGEILYHPQLFKDYPELRDFPVSVKKQPYGVMGSFHHPIEGAGPVYNRPAHIEMDPGADKDTLLHEVQHAIQQKEGMSLGHLTESERDQYKGYLIRKYSDKLGLEDVADLIEKGGAVNKNEARYKASQILNKADRDTYLNLAHEQEAWNVARRMNMTAAERSKSLAKDTETAPREDQIKFKHEYQHLPLGGDVVQRTKPYLDKPPEDVGRWVSNPSGKRKNKT